MSDVLSRDSRPVDATVSYGAHADQVYDVRRPQGPDQRVLVVVVHGGFWRPAYDRTHTGAQSEGLAAHGYHVAIPEYRRDAGWEAVATDVRTAIAAIRADVELPDRVVLLGHSAGGHLALWLTHQPEAAGVVGVVILGACADLHLVHELGLGDGAAEALMGCTPAQDAARWAAADPARLAPSPVPVHLLHGERDDQVPIRVSRSYSDAATARGGEATLEALPDVGHYEPIDPLTPAFETVVRTIAATTSD